MTSAGDLLLSNLLPLASPTDYKLHFARRDNTRPLDDYLESWDRWVGWQQYWPGRNDFNRRYIFSMMDFHPEPDIWLFGGIFEVLGLIGKSYDVAITDQAAGLIGRLKIRYPYKTRMTRPYLESHYGRMVVSELLPKPYAGRVFPGYNMLDLSFRELEVVARTSRPDWKQALELIKGVYLITDTNTEKRYVGSAYGGAGIWSRWSDYAWTGHGGKRRTSSARTGWRPHLLPRTPADYAARAPRLHRVRRNRHGPRRLLENRPPVSGPYRPKSKLVRARPRCRNWRPQLAINSHPLPWLDAPTADSGLLQQADMGRQQRWSDLVQARRLEPPRLASSDRLSA